jgi:histidine kinase/two component regulator with propeller domain
MVRNPVTCFLIIALWVCPALVFCRNFPIQHFTIENGLPSNSLYGAYRDSKGFIWIGTDKGAVRYNGIEFEKFTTDDGLPDNEIFSFREDYEGRLWLATFNGELCFYKDGIFHNSGNTPFLKKSISYSYINWIGLEKDSSVTMLFGVQYAFVNVRHGQCRPYLLNKAKSPGTDAILTIDKVAEDKYKVLCRDKTYLIDTGSNFIPNTLHTNKELYVFLYSQNGKYLSSATGLYSFNEELLMKFEPGLSKSHIYCVFGDKNDWYFGTGNGLCINNDIQILRGNKITSITQDVEGNYWMATLDNGLYCLSNDYLKFNQYDSVYTGSIRYAQALGGKLFFTTNTGNIYRFENGQASLVFDYFKHFGKFFKGDNTWENYINTNNYGRGLDRSYKYYNLDEHFSFVIDNVNSGKPVVQMIKIKDYPTNIHIKELFFEQEDIFIRNSDHISMLRKSDLKSGNLLSKKVIGNYVSGRRIFGVALASENSIWFSSFDGVNKVVDSVTIPQPQFGRITFKWMQIAGNYAVGITQKNQLLICRNFESKYISIDSIPGSSFVWDKLYKFNDSTFLVSTNSLYRLLSLHAANIKPTVHIIENSSIPLHAEYICSDDSSCYFFKQGSITRVPVDAFIETYRTPKIFFKSLKTRTNTYLVSDGMTINYDEAKNISITFSPFSFGSKYLVCDYSISKDATEYWRQVKNNEINLFDPSFGNYTIKVRARTLSGSFSQPFEFNFSIAKPFWATYWFIALVTLLVIGLIVLTIRLITIRNTRKKEREHQNELKFLKSEYRALNALMNPHFIFNTLNNVQWLVNNDDKLTANHYLRVFSDLIRQNMNNITKELIPLSSEIELVNNYLKLEKLRFKEAFNYEIKIDENLDIEQVKIPPLLIQPLVENAIKHGLLPGTTANNLLTMNIYRKTDKLYIDIADNGIGFNESQKKSRSLHKSTGIENIKKRIEKLSMMHDINISFAIDEVKDPAGLPAGTFAQICIVLEED